MATTTTTPSPQSPPSPEVTRRLATGRSRDRTPASLIFLGLLWFSLFFGVAVLLALIIDTAIEGRSRFDLALLTEYESIIHKDETGFRGGILGSIWMMVATVVLSVPLGIAAAVHLEEMADRHRWYNRAIEVNIQNLAAVPALIYGMLAVGAMNFMEFDRTGIVLGGAIALGLLVLPVIIITTREALRAVPREIREGSLALGATTWQTTWRNTLPSAVPGITTGTILGLSRAIGEAAPLIALGTVTVRTDPSGLFSAFTALPAQIFTLSSYPQEEFEVAVAAAIVVLLAMVLAMNAVAIFIRNKFQKVW